MTKTHLYMLREDGFFSELLTHSWLSMRIPNPQVQKRTPKDHHFWSVSFTPHEHSPNMAFISWNKIPSPPNKPESQPPRKGRKIKGPFQTIKCHLVFVFNMSLSSTAEHNSTYTQKRPLSVVLIPVVMSPDNQGSWRTSHSLCVAGQVILFLWVCFFSLKKNGFT